VARRLGAALRRDDGGAGDHTAGAWRARASASAGRDGRRGSLPRERAP
jgi:hypothetical protein